jgi:bifunctional oligoribonuclease and PAP phosphatase NrnA
MSPDGDCVGSQLAMAWYLESQGKVVRFQNVDPVPYKFAFLQGVERLTVTQTDPACDVLVVLDASNPDRLGWQGAASVAPTVINIDHHHDNTRFGTYNLVNHAAATGQILYGLFEDGGVHYPQPVAESLYAAIMSDTGGFRFSNTDGEVLRVCGSLASRGADPSRIYERVFASTTRNGMRLHASIWPTLAFHCDGRVCTMSLPLALIDTLGATYGDTEGMADLTIMAEEVLVGMFIKYTDTQTHFSLRSRTSIDVGSIARRVTGGGGHINAAGCTMHAPMAEAVPKMLAIVEQELS